MTAATDLRPDIGRLAILAALLATVLVYLPGLKGGFIFDDFVNIVENPALVLAGLGEGSWAAAIFSSGSSDIQRPVAMVSFLANIATSGLNPLPMKVVNLIVHLVNGILIYRLTMLLVEALRRRGAVDGSERHDWLPAFVAAAWLLAPVNLIPVVYVVQRMESLAQIFVLLALITYCRYRLDGGARALSRPLLVGFPVFIVLGILTKESAALAVLYAFAIEWLVFRFDAADGTKSRSLKWYFVAILWVPAIVGGLALWLKYATPAMYVTRPFTLVERLLTELRVVLTYVEWTLVPRYSQLSLYHDDIVLSKGWLDPATTLWSAFGLAGLAAFGFLVRRARPLIALGIAWFFAAQLLTATFLPLDLVYEHRNYFASFGLLLAVGSELLRASGNTAWRAARVAAGALLLFLFVPTTFKRVQDWSDPLRLAQAEAARHPASPRATYQLGQAYVAKAYDHPDNASYVQGAFEALERAAKVPLATALPEQALLIFAERVKTPVKAEWWASLEAKLGASTVDVSDTAALNSIVLCAMERRCVFEHERVLGVFGAALGHEPVSPDVLTIYANYAMNLMSDPELALRLMSDAVSLKPRNLQYRENRAALLVAMGRKDDAQEDIREIERGNRFGSEQPRLDRMRRRIEADLRPFAPPAEAR